MEHPEHLRDDPRRRVLKPDLAETIKGLDGTSPRYRLLCADSGGGR